MQNPAVVGRLPVSWLPSFENDFRILEAITSYPSSQQTPVPGLSMMPPQKLGAFAMGAAMRRAGLDPEEVEILGETSGGGWRGPGWLLMPWCKDTGHLHVLGPAKNLS